MFYKLTGMGIVWQKEYELGIEKIDSQHKRLIDLINQLDLACGVKKSPEEVEKIFLSLVNYTNYHFTAEEMVMKKNGYPLFENHKSKHDFFVQKISQFNRQIREDNTLALSDTIDFLNTWLVEHIMGEDRKYVPILKEKFNGKKDD
ncbi:MAG: bacteriohemerythrin [Spirochaetia bacterium]|nr:bacteriohemerythrin [Spirochaetia bacterium]